jgi:single-strand DNA-binding protein
MLNKIMLMGRLVKNPELRYTNTSNIPVAGFSVAVTRRAKKGQDPVVDFIPVVAWQGTALFVSRYFKQGQPICVDGRLQQVSWVDKTTGDTKYSFEVIADNVHFAGFLKDQTAADVAANEEFDPCAETAELPAAA